MNQSDEKMLMRYRELSEQINVLYQGPTVALLLIASVLKEWRDAAK